MPWIPRMATADALKILDQSTMVQQNVDRPRVSNGPKGKSRMGDEVNGLGFPCHRFFSEPHISRPRRFPVIIPAYTPSTAFPPLRKRPGLGPT